jgi:hypothetical protein
MIAKKLLVDLETELHEVFVGMGELILDKIGGRAADSETEGVGVVIEVCSFDQERIVRREVGDLFRKAKLKLKIRRIP